MYESVITSRGPKLSEADVAIETGIFQMVSIKGMEKKCATDKLRAVFVQVLPITFTVD
jgi:hypothetical protein